MSLLKHPVLGPVLARVESEGSYTAHMAAYNALAAAKTDSSLETLRVGVVRNFTVEPLLPVIESEIARAGFIAKTYLGEFDAIAADALNTSSALAQSNPQIIVMALWLEAMAPQLATRFTAMSADEVSAEIARVVSDTREMLTGMRRFSQSPVLLNNFPLPARRARGILDAQRDDSQTEAVLTLNRRLRALANEIGNVFIVDYMSLFAAAGSEAFDERNWVHRRSPLGRRALLPIGQEYGKLIRALLGKVRKCVVVDCDNTLWGGIIGEDGMSGIQLGEGHPGSSHIALQRELINLCDRGVLVALCSKNNEADVMEVLRGHPLMLLKETHVACHRINWEDKASNLRAIANELNIGVDALVFVDDSAFECGLVREQLPEIAVVQLTGDDFADQLTRPGFFDSLVTSKEDKKRTAHFKAEAARREMQTSSGSLQEYLQHLEMVAEVGAAHDDVVPRVAQLTQKTNQFNLTTRRYTEADIRRFVESDSTDVLYIKLKDKVADLGIIGVAILRTEGGVAEIDSFLLSCRALGRGVEIVLLDRLRRLAEERGAKRMRGVFIPTAKNAQVASFFQNAGFDREGSEASSVSFIAPLFAVRRPETAITVVHPPVPQHQAS